MRAYATSSIDAGRSHKSASCAASSASGSVTHCASVSNTRLAISVAAALV
ncbi:MAG: hypothetical protein M5U16_11725 [Hyphomicrobium sp.]|nr:hypothetical protein [Hyphomicrobium sp.]